jgi:glycosyltransferase involved in cell wall biosynthesis
MAANNGEVGGGEVMLLATARLVASLGADVEIVGPDAPGGVLDLGADEGFVVHRLAADRRRYLHDLREWHAGRRELLWCHGLVPAFATAGRPGRVVHLHKLPSRTQRAGYLAARSRSWLTLVPSRWMAARVPGARVLPNWTPDLAGPARDVGSPRRLGYLGRHSVDKGLVVLAEALRLLSAEVPVRLVLAGGPRFDDDAAVRPVDTALAALPAGVVERVGWVDTPSFLRTVDGLVAPSVAPESFGLSVAEAMSAGVPCVVSDAGALPEVVGPAHPFVAPAGDAPALAAAIDAWARADRSELADVARAQRARWQGEHAPDVARERVRGILDSLPSDGRA